MSDAKGDLRGAAAFYEQAGVPYAAALRLTQLAAAQLCPGGQPLLPAKAQKQYMTAASTVRELLTRALQVSVLSRSDSAQASAAERDQVSPILCLGRCIACGKQLAAPEAEPEQLSSAMQGLAEYALPCNTDAASRYLAAACLLDAVAAQLQTATSASKPQVSGRRSQPVSLDDLLAHAVLAWGSLRSTASAFLRACQQLGRGAVDAQEATQLGACELLLGVTTDPQRPGLRVVWDRKAATWLPTELRSGGVQVLLLTSLAYDAQCKWAGSCLFCRS